MVVLAGMGSIKLRWDTVREVIDGDTVVIANGQKVRLLGIDAPDMEYCGGEEAKKELEELALGRRIKLTETRVDQFKRILALVYIKNTLINEKMIDSGWVHWDGTENNLGSKFSRAAKMAAEEKRGVFGKCREAENPECIIKGNIEKRSGEIGEGGRKIYFFPGCSEYAATIVEKELGEEWYCTEAEAEAAGFEKGGNCFGKSYSKLK